jgi:hypothetical protein
MGVSGFVEKLRARATASRLDENLVDGISAFDADEFLVEAVVEERKFVGVNPKQVEDRRM